MLTNKLSYFYQKKQNNCLKLGQIRDLNSSNSLLVCLTFMQKTLKMQRICFGANFLTNKNTSPIC